MEWFKTELAGVEEVKESNEIQLNKLKNEVAELEMRTSNMKAEVKASKRYLKLNAVKLSQIEQNKQDLVQMSARVDFERSTAIKSSAAMPALHLSPFLPLSS